VLDDDGRYYAARVISLHPTKGARMPFEGYEEEGAFTLTRGELRWRAVGRCAEAPAAWRRVGGGGAHVPVGLGGGGP
jgi:hypothetical protein